jgi:cellulose synthase/poly-beta-1,6-N-acetylglucosamine synthase-like glycosyltransferase
MDAVFSFWIAGIGICIVLIYLWFWIKIARFYYSENIELTSLPPNILTIIIPFRNEEKHLKKLVQHFENTPELKSFPILFINDHSTDNSILILQECLSNSSLNAKIIHLSADQFSKKNAIHAGIMEANTQLIYTTDADCKPSVHTLSTLYSKLVSTQSKLLLGPVNFIYKPAYFFGSYQLLENISLVALGFFQLKKGKPTMGNGANMMFHKQIYLDLNPFQFNQHVAGGDDIFFIEKCYAQNANWVQFANTKHAEVTTHLCETYSELYNQRIRWAKKSPLQQTKKTQFSQIVLVLFFLVFEGCLTTLLFVEAYVLCLFVFFLKLLGDAYFLHEIAKKSGHDLSLIQIFKASLFQPVFILWIAISQFWVPVNWKNRMYP